MFYEWKITVPKNTTSYTQIGDDLQVTSGVIHRLNVEFPAGCAGLVDAKILERGVQIFPRNRDESFNTDDFVIDTLEHHKLLGPQPRLTVLVKNTDDTHNHTIRIRVGILPEYILLPQFVLRPVLERLLRFFGVG